MNLALRRGLINDGIYVLGTDDDTLYVLYATDPESHSKGFAVWGAENALDLDRDQHSKSWLNSAWRCVLKNWHPTARLLKTCYQQKIYNDEFDYNLRRAAGRTSSFALHYIRRCFLDIAFLVPLTLANHLRRIGNPRRDFFDGTFAASDVGSI